MRDFKFKATDEIEFIKSNFKISLLGHGGSRAEFYASALAEILKF